MDKLLFALISILLLFGCGDTRNSIIRNEEINVISKPNIISNKLIIESDSKLCKKFFNQDLTKDLCTALTQNNSLCSENIIFEIKSRNRLYQPKELCGLSTMELPADASQSCKSILNNFLWQDDPVKTACKFRYTSLEKETITCRSSISKFINTHSIGGVGKNVSNCGQ